MTLGTLKCTTIEDDDSNSITVATLTSLDTDKANLSGATFTGDVLLDNEQELRLGEADGNGADFIALKAPADLSDTTTTYTLPAGFPASNGHVLSSTTTGTMSWVANPDTDTVFSVATSHNWTAGQRGQITTLDSGATVNIDFNDSNNFILTLGHDVTDITIENATAGQSGSIFIAQPTSGSTTHTVGGWDEAFKFPGAEAPTLSTAINKVDRVDYIIRSATQIHVVATLDMAV